MQLPRNISIGYDSFCVASLRSTICAQLPHNGIPVGLQDMLRFTPELTDSVTAVEKELRSTNPRVVQILLLVGAVFLVALVVITNFIVTSHIDAELRSRSRVAVSFAAASGISACALFGTAASLAICKTARIRSIGPPLAVQRGNMGEACLAILSCGITTFLVTAFNALW